MRIVGPKRPAVCSIVMRRPPTIPVASLYVVPVTKKAEWVAAWLLFTVMLSRWQTNDKFSRTTKNRWFLYDTRPIKLDSNFADRTITHGVHSWFYHSSVVGFTLQVIYTLLLCLNEFMLVIFLTACHYLKSFNWISSYSSSIFVFTALAAMLAC